jgi:hypothetical protein
LPQTREGVPHELHDEVSEKNRDGPFKPLWQTVHHDRVPGQNSKQVLESSALDYMVGSEQRDQRSGNVADEVAESGIDTKPPELAKTEGAANKFMHGHAP